MKIRWVLIWLGVLAAALVSAQDERTVRAIEVRGLRNISEDVVLRNMELQVGSVYTDAARVRDINSLLDVGVFLEVDIQAAGATATEVDLTVDVVEQPVILELRILGNESVSTERLTQRIREIQPLGRPYNFNRATLINEAIQEEYQREDIPVTVLQIEPEQESPNTLLIVLAENRIQDVIITGLNRTNPFLVQRVLQLRPGDPFRIRNIQQNVGELAATGWFEGFPDVQVRQGDQIGDVILDITVQEARTAQLLAGVALDPQSRFVGTVSFQDANFRGQGENIGVFISQATVGGGLSAELAYGLRYFDDQRTSVQSRLYSTVRYNFTGTGFGAIGTQEGERFDERRTGLALTATRPQGDFARVRVGLKAERVETINIGGADPNEFIQQDGDLFLAEFGWESTDAFPVLEPYTGSRLSLIFEPGFSNITRVGGALAEQAPLGQNFFLRNTIEYRQYWSAAVPEDTPWDTPRPVTAVRARYGFITGQVPFFEQLFVGGTQSLRGYANQRFWGRQSLLLSAEYRYPIQQNLSLIGFVDYGGAWGGFGTFRDFSQSNNANLRLGYGVGVSFRSPFGPIRIDFGFNQEGGSRTHFQIGGSF